MVAYLDSSVLMEHVLRGDNRIREVFEMGDVVSSELLEIECMRVLHRYRMEGVLTDAGFLEAKERLGRVLDGISVVALSPAVKRRASQSFPVMIKTLDALHLASALACAEARPENGMAVFSLDRGFNRCARALGLRAPFAE
jgi:predicted nucleic acid-binding protein